MPGWSILCCRTTDDNPGKLSWETHCVVCKNGKPVWDPCGYRLPLDWDGFIRERKWQIVEPLVWVSFVTLDPTQPTGTRLRELPPMFLDMVEQAIDLLRELDNRTIKYRPGIQYGFFLNHLHKIIAAYTDAATDGEGEEAVIQVLRELRIKSENLPAPARGPSVHEGADALCDMRS